MYQIRPENEFWYGYSGYMIGANVVKMYNNPLMPMGTVVLMPTVVFVLNTVSQRPTKKGKRDTCKRLGTVCCRCTTCDFTLIIDINLPYVHVSLNG